MQEKYLENRLKKLKLLEAKKALYQGLPHLYGLPHYKWSREFFESREKMNFLCAANQIGKALDVEEMIPTPTGFTRLGSLQIGDYVIGMDGKPTRIIEIPFEGTAECYLVCFDNGHKVIASEDHEWVIRKHRNFPNKENIITTAKMRDYGNYDIKYRTGFKDHIHINYTKPIQFTNEQKLFDPYLVGWFISKGNLQGIPSLPLISFNRYHSRIAEYKTYAKMEHERIYFPEIANELLESGIHRNGRGAIPINYLRGTITERRELLLGLADSCANIEMNYMTFASFNKQFIESIAELIRSLACKATVIRRVDRSYYLLARTDFMPFTSHEMIAKYKSFKFFDFHEVSNVIKIDPHYVRCLRVDNQSGTFLFSKFFIPTHNSSVQIRKAIHWCTEKQLWPHLFFESYKTNPKFKPDFWYLYPSREVATEQFNRKWIENFLPTNEFINHPQFGWTAEYGIKKAIDSLTFNTGAKIKFMTYSQNISNQQSATLAGIFCDEELPEESFSEYSARLFATDGFFHMVFTPTIGQEIWYRCMEMQKTRYETFKEAAKWVVSMYDCLKYEDGTPSGWTKERIRRNEARCKSDAEIQRRIHGRFVQDTDLVYPSFSRTLNYIEGFLIKNDWPVYAGVDIGSGGEKNNPAAIVFVACKPDYSELHVFKGWRGDKIYTTASDIFNKYLELKGKLNMTGAYYDYASYDFGSIAQSHGEMFQPANKSHSLGEGMLNVLFKNQMLFIHQDDELEKLVIELLNHRHDVAKSKKKNDLIDALRYAISTIPVDWGHIGEGLAAQYAKTETPNLEKYRRAEDNSDKITVFETAYADLIEANEMYDF